MFYATSSSKPSYTHHGCVTDALRVLDRHAFYQLLRFFSSRSYLFTIYNPFSLFPCAFSFCFTENSARIPEVVAQRMCRVHPVNPSLVPSVEDAIQMYTDAGGTITLNSSFGIDPLASSDALINQRETEFTQNNPSFDDIYSDVINGDGSFMAAAVLSFVNITRNLVP